VSGEIQISSLEEQVKLADAHCQQLQSSVADQQSTLDGLKLGIGSSELNSKKLQELIESKQSHMKKMQWYEEKCSLAGCGS